MTQTLIKWYNVHWNIIAVNKAERCGKKVKRAKKGLLSFGERKTAGHERKRNVDKNKLFNINDEEKKEFQLKYYGKTMEDEPASEVEETPEESTEQAVTENQAEEEEVIDDDMKIVGEKREETPIVVEKSVKKAEKGTKKKVMILSVSLAVIVVVSVITIALGGMFDKISLFNNDSATINKDYVAPIDEITGKVNVLVLGVDKEGLRTDTIIVASLDTNTNSVNLLSIPRDTRMYIGSRYQKINAAHAITKNGKIKGPQGSIEAVTRLTGIPINYYVEFSFTAFRDTIDALGGVYFNVPQNMRYSDPIQNLRINLSAGYQLLDGDKSEQLVRFRQYPEGDIKRLRVQQDFIKAVAEQKLNGTIITKLPDLYKSLTKNIKTNFRLSDMTKFAPYLLKLDTNNINMYELPGEYSGAEYAASYWLPDMEALKLLIGQTFGYDASKITTGKAGEAPATYRPKATSTPTPKQTESTSADIAQTTAPVRTTEPVQSTAPVRTTKPVQSTAPTAIAPVSTPQITTEPPNEAPVEAIPQQTEQAISTDEPVQATQAPVVEETPVAVVEPTVEPTPEQTQESGFVRPGIN